MLLKHKLAERMTCRKALCNLDYSDKSGFLVLKMIEKVVGPSVCIL